MQVLNANDQVSSIERNHDGETLAVKSVTRGVCGEGPFAGWPAVTVNLAGCNLACWYCDTVYKIHDGEERWGLDDVCRQVSMQPVPVQWPLVVLTGGEPFRQNIRPLISRLLNLGFQVHIETSGSAYQDLGAWWGHPALTVCCSPKVAKVHSKLEPHVDSYLYVLRAGEVNPEDGMPLGPETIARPKRAWLPVYVQPLDEQDLLSNEANVKAAAETAVQFGFRVSLRMQRLLGIS